MIFTKYEQYKAENAERLVKSQELHDKAKELQFKVATLKSDYEAKLVDSAINGTDNSKDLDRLDTEIAKVEKESKRATEIYNLYAQTKVGLSVTKDDVIEAWNSELNPTHYQTKVQPALDRMESIKADYLEAMAEYFAAIKEITAFREEVSSSFGQDFPYNFHITDIETTQEYNRFFVRQSDIDEAKKGGNQ